MARKLLKINDSAWLFAESDRTPTQVGMLATFRVPEDRPTFVSDLVARWRAARRFSPPFNYRFAKLPAPGWVEVPDDRIDLDYHLRHLALPAPGNQRELGVLVSRLHSSVMDRRYPLWECHVIEGLRDDATDGDATRWALYIKAHHSQVDGVGGVRLLRRMLSVDPDARDMLPPWAVGAHGPDQSGLPPRERKDASRIGSDGGGPGLVEVVRGGLRSSASIAGSLGRTYAETLTGRLEPERAAPYQAPRSMLNGRIHTPRRFATQHYPTDRLRRLARAADASLNDVFLALCSGALRRYLLEQDALPGESLVANVPMSVRAHEGARVGNALTFLHARLGTHLDGPLRRMEAIKESTRLAKDRLPSAGQSGMDVYTVALMAPFLAQAVLGVGGHGRPSSNVVVSNVPGPAEQRWLDGSPMEEIFPLSLLLDGMALNITAVSYAGGFNIGVTGCRDSVPHLQRIAVYAGEELRLLEEAYGVDADAAPEPAASP